MKHSRANVLVIGMALFSMFFGAGNIIFPPYLGLESGTQWGLGFTCYYLADIGLSVVAIFAILKYKGDVDRFMGHLGRIPGMMMLSAIILCIGPLIAVPRTGATTYEMFVVPVLGDIPPVIAMFVFFGIILLFTIRKSSVVDILGKFLTPVLFLGLLYLIFKGILSPIGSVTDTFRSDSVVLSGVSAGYQTMDSLAAVVFGIIVVNTVREKGYTEERQQYKIAMYSSLVAAAGLFMVYGGLTYLGATSTGNMSGRLLRTELMIYITQALMGRFGVVLLGIVVTLACITTAVALISASADHFSKLSGGRLKYESLTIFLCLFSAVLSTIGTDQIVAIASPILTLLYPGMLTLIILSFFAEQMKDDKIIHGAVIAAIATSLCEILYGWGMPLGFVSHLPLYKIGFGWVLPAVVGGIIGAVLFTAAKQEK